MDFDFSDEQNQLRDAVQRWVAKGYGFERRRAAVAAGGFDRRAYQEMAELGLSGLTIAEADGGMGMGPVEAMVVMEELGRGMVLEPLGQTLMASALLSCLAEGAVRGAWLGRIASGEALVVLAHQERGARYRLDHCQAEAQADGTGWRVSGEKHLVAAGDLADAWVVPAQLAGRMALFLVQGGTEGSSASGHLCQDGSRAATVRLANSPAELITRDGLDALRYATDLGLAALCAEAVGLMDTTLALTVDYMNTRQQFGTPIARFQALRHRVADMKMQLELGRSMSYYASLKLGSPSDERRTALSRAKLQLGQSMRFVGQQAVQLHGGIGVTDEYIVSHCFKRLTALEMSLGDSLHHLGEVSARMGETAGVFG